MPIKRFMNKKISQKNFTSSLSRKHTGVLGQSVVEYSLLIGIVISVAIVFSPMAKRVTQGMVKLVADEVGIQNAAEGVQANVQQIERGRLLSTDITVDMDQEQVKSQWRSGTTHSVQTNYRDATTTETLSESDLGTRDK